MEHKKKTFFKVTGPYDAFDNLRASIFKNKSMALMGLIWGWPLDEIFMEEPATRGNGHAVAAIGYATEDEEPYLVIQNSYGINAGAGGKHYLSRKVVNDAVEKYSAFMFLDLCRPQAQFLNAHKLGTKWLWLANIWLGIKKLFI